MPAPAYAKIIASIGKFFSATVDPGATAGQAGFPQAPFNLPALPGLDMTVGTGIAQFNVLGVKGATAAGAIVDTDLTAIPDPFGNAVNMANVRFIWLLNDAIGAGFVLNFGAAATNPWTALFAAGATFKFTVPPGAVVNGVNYPGQAFIGSPAVGQLPVTGTSKVLRADPGANTVPFRIALIGDMV
jgi:hypothetical protein